MKMRIPLLLLILAVFTATAYTHGGGIAPPRKAPTRTTTGPVVAPRGAGGAQARPQPGGGPQNGPGTPNTPIPGTRMPATPPHPLSPEGQAFALDLTDWMWWWELNKERFLNVRSRMTVEGAQTGSDGFFLGRGAQTTRIDLGVRPSPEQIRDEIMPALLGTIEGESAANVISSGMIALARIGEESAGATAELGKLFRQYLRHPNGEVAEMALISQGILGDEAAIFPLADLIHDTKAGRVAVRETEVSWRFRGLAAYALTLIAANNEREEVRRFVVHTLRRALDEDDTATSELSAACIIGLGRIPLASTGQDLDEIERLGIPASGSREALVVYLLGKLRDDGLHRMARAHVPTSLALLVSDPGFDGTPLKKRVADAVLERFASPREKREVRQSCAIGLGWIGDSDEDLLDAKIRKALIGATRDSGDLQARNFALIAAGQVAARNGRGAAVGADELRRHLLRRLSVENGGAQRWTALALALAGRGELQRGQVLSEAYTTPLRFELRKARVPDQVGAFSLACGLLCDLEAAPLLEDKLARTSEDVSRGHVAIGLGLMDSRSSLEPMRELLPESIFRPDLLRELSMALGLLGDQEVADVLMKMIDRTRSLSAQASIARSLGRIGDRRTVEPLVAMLTDERLTDRARSIAAVALGLVADEQELPWNTLFGIGLNYAAAPVLLLDHQGGGGLLDIL